MKLLVVGGGGREHAIIKKLKENSSVEKIYALPGNGGIAADAECVSISAKDIDGIVRFAVDNKIDYAVVAPDDPLVLGAVDALTAAGIPCFGPEAKAAIIEGSKIFSKNLWAIVLGAPMLLLMSSVPGNELRTALILVALFAFILVLQYRDKLFKKKK